MVVDEEEEEERHVEEEESAEEGAFVGGAGSPEAFGRLWPPASLLKNLFIETEFSFVLF